MKKILLITMTALCLFLAVGCQEKKIDKVFVYGSLRSDMFNYKIYLDGKVTSNKKANIEGVLLHIDNKGYPAVLSGNGQVAGELMEFKNFDETLKELDELEAYVEGDEDENEYNRKIVDVKLEDGSTEKAYYYEYNPLAEYNKDDVLIEVDSGDWKEFMEK